MAVDKTLATAVKAAKGGKAMQFAFLPKGASSKLLVDRKLAAAAVNAAKKQAGVSQAIRGKLFGEEGTLVFEVAKKPPPTLEAQIKKVLKDSAGMTTPVEVRLGGGGDVAEIAARLEELRGRAAAALGQGFRSSRV